jgi:hypothetical protein
MFDRIKNRTLIVSEIHPQHHGSMSEIKRMILQSKIGGADFIKVQLYNSNKMFKNDERKYLEINKDELIEINDYSKNVGIGIFASVFDEEKIDWCEDLNFPIYKIASITVKNRPLCKKIISLNKPVIISLGMYTKKKIPFNNKNVQYLYCVSEYPTNLEKIKMPNFKNNIYFGYSDHTIGIAASIYAVSNGAKMIEKHFSLNKSINLDTEKAHICSMDFDDLKTLREISDCISMLRAN